MREVGLDDIATQLADANKDSFVPCYRLATAQAQHALLELFFFHDTATTEIYTLSLHDALPIWHRGQHVGQRGDGLRVLRHERGDARSEEHTSELQSLAYLVCRLLLEKKKRRRAAGNNA